MEHADRPVPTPTADAPIVASNRRPVTRPAVPCSSALQPRLLQTVVEIAAERDCTLIVPFPVELLRFLDAQSRVATRTAPTGPPPAAAPASG